MVTGVEIRGPVLDGEGGDPERGTSETVVRRVSHDYFFSRCVPSAQSAHRMGLQ